MIGLSPWTLLSMALHPVRTLKWIITFVPAMNQMKRLMPLNEALLGLGLNDEEE
jgi:hypothetical protein